MLKIFNANTQQHEDAVFTLDHNNEIVATFADKTFIKFPAGTSKEEIMRLAQLHYEHNNGNEVITPEMEAKAAADRAAGESLVNELNGNTMPQGDQNSAASSQEQTS